MRWRFNTAGGWTGKAGRSLRTTIGELMPNILGLHRLHRVHLLTSWALFAALSLGACGGGSSGSGSSSPGEASIVVATTPAPPAGIVTNAYGYSFAVASAGSPSPTGKPLQGDHHVLATLRMRFTSQNLRRTT